MYQTAAVKWLNDLFEGEGVIAATGIRFLAEEAGIPWRNVQRAKKKLRITSVRTAPRGAWIWVKPDEEMYRAVVVVHVLATSEEEIERLMPEYLERSPYISKAYLFNAEIDPDLEKPQ